MFLLLFLAYFYAELDMPIFEYCLIFYQQGINPMKEMNNVFRGLPVPLLVYNAKLEDGLANLTFRNLIRNIG